MPIYEYECSKGHRFESIQKVNDPPLKKCERCKSKAERLISSPAIQFKGTGWYVTDYAKKETGKDKARAESGGAKAKDESDGAKAKAESGGAKAKAESDGAKAKAESGEAKAKAESPKKKSSDKGNGNKSA